MTEECQMHIPDLTTRVQYLCPLMLLLRQLFSVRFSLDGFIQLVKLELSQRGGRGATRPVIVGFWYGPRRERSDDVQKKIPSSVQTALQHHATNFFTTNFRPSSFIPLPLTCMIHLSPSPLFQTWWLAKSSPGNEEIISDFISSFIHSFIHASSSPVIVSDRILLSQFDATEDGGGGVNIVNSTTFLVVAKSSSSL